MSEELSASSVDLSECVRHRGGERWRAARGEGISTLTLNRSVCSEAMGRGVHVEVADVKYPGQEVVPEAPS